MKGKIRLPDVGDAIEKLALLIDDNTKHIELFNKNLEKKASA